MTFWQSIFLGLVQGITEFLPVSSSGHLAIFQILFGIEDTGLLFDVLLHVGTLAAVVVAYYKDVWELIRELVAIIGDLCYNLVVFFAGFGKKPRVYHRILDTGYRRFVVLIIVSTIPTAIIGYLLRHVVDAASTILLVPGCCLLITAVILVLGDLAKPGNKGPKQAGWLNALIIGICQGFATLPGISRSGTTITASVLCGFKREFAVKYSFILSIPAIIGAMIMELHDASHMAISASQATSYIIGMIVAAVAGYICIKLMLVIVKRRRFKYFAIYCAAVGVACIIAFAVMA